MANVRSSLPSRLRQVLSTEGSISHSFKLDSELPFYIGAFFIDIGAPLLSGNKQGLSSRCVIRPLFKLCYILALCEDPLARKNISTPIPYTSKYGIEDMCGAQVGDDEIAVKRREGRKSEANDFRRRYTYGSIFDHKTSVWPVGTHEWEDQSSGIIWVGVHRLDSVCVVTRTGDLIL